MSAHVPVIRSASLRGYADLARAHGLNPLTAMRRAGLDPRCLDDPEKLVSVLAVRKLLELSAAESGAEDFGLLMARDRRLANLGPLSLVLREEPTARRALDVLARYLRLLNSALHARIEDYEDVVVIREELLHGNTGSMRQSIELAVGVMFRILSELLGPAWAPRRVCFMHRAPRSLATHRAVFGARVEFNSDFNGIVCAAKDLSAQLPSLDTGVAIHARRFLDQALSSSRPKTGDSARQLIAALLPGGRCTADLVAQQLGIDRRTLHRHLRLEGETFSSLMQSMREQFAMHQIREGDRGLAELADLLGFSGASAFAYWFRHRFGCTVSQWRETERARLAAAQV